LIKPSDLHQPDILTPAGARGQHADRSGLEIGGHDRLDEQSWLAEQFGGRQVKRPVETEHRAEGAQRVTRQRFLTCRCELLRRGGTARIVVLDHRHRWKILAADDLYSGVEVQQVVIRQLFAADLTRRYRISCAHTWIVIGCGPLVWVLTV